jgi:hypothetical protein
MVPARISFVTLAVQDMLGMRAFFRSLGWDEAPNSDDGHATFRAGGASMMLDPFGPLAEESGFAGARPPVGFRGFTLAINVESAEAVDAAFAVVRAVGGATVTAEPGEQYWGGYSGYFSDPEGNVWEIAYNPFVTFADNGALVF